MDRQAVGVLQRARALIEQGWVQEVGAVDGRGNAVWPSSKKAVAWCVVGACRAATSSRRDRDAARAALEATKPRGYFTRDIMELNDALPLASGKRTVLRWFDRAIAKAQTDE